MSFKFVSCVKVMLFYLVLVVGLVGLGCIIENILILLLIKVLRVFFFANFSIFIIILILINFIIFVRDLL